MRNYTKEGGPRDEEVGTAHAWYRNTGVTTAARPARSGPKTSCAAGVSNATVCATKQRLHPLGDESTCDVDATDTPSVATMANIRTEILNQRGIRVWQDQVWQDQVWQDQVWQDQV